MQVYKGQNLDRINPSAQRWTNYSTPIAVIVEGVKLDAQKRIRVNVTALRYDFPFPLVQSADPAPQIGDRGVLVWLDGRRDSPVYFGVVKTFQPSSATVVAVNGSTVNLTVGLNSEPVVGVPYLTYPGTSPAYTPQVGDKGLLFYKDGLSTSPVYMGPLSQ